MRTPSKRDTESAGSAFPTGLRSAVPVPASHPAPAARRGGASPPLSRRSMVATLVAALVPAAGTAVALPKAMETAAAVLPPPAASAGPAIGAAASESRELLALGVELDAKLQAYRAAAARLAEARAVATHLWPDAPASIVAAAGNRHIKASPGRYPGCYEEETDFEGNQWPDIVCGAGRGAPLPRYIAVSGALEALRDDVRADPEDWELGFERELTDRIEVADRYEEACFEAVEVSDIEARKAEAEACADDLLDLAHEVRKHPPRTIVGVMIHARALAGYANAEQDGFLKAPGQAAVILGRGLADAVLRIGGLER